MNTVPVGFKGEHNEIKAALKSKESLENLMEIATDQNDKDPSPVNNITPLGKMFKRIDLYKIVLTNESRFTLYGNDSMYSWTTKNNIYRQMRPYRDGSVIVAVD